MRQWVSLLTRRTTDFVSRESVRRQSVSGPSSAATSDAKRARSSSAVDDTESARMAWRVKNHPVSSSE